MEEFFSGMGSFERTYWIIALIGSAVFAVIFILTFIGGDIDGDMAADGTDFDADDGGVGYQFFTFKNVVAFFTVFGWTGILCMDNECSNLVSLLIATLAGLAMMALTSLIFFWMHKLTASGTLKVSNAIGVIGEVYLPIGEKRASVGKVQIKVQGSLRELEAVTDEAEQLATGALVEVTEIIGNEILLVKKV